jgi:formamidopyrimidine-DNA glycosylase
MPELPEVQTTVNGINAVAKGLTIIDVWTEYNSHHYHGSDTIKDPKYFTYFKKNIVDRKILNAERRAKNILIHLSGGFTILIHMKMTGHMMLGQYEFNSKGHGKHGDKWIPHANAPQALHDPFNRFIRLVFTLSKRKHLVLSDMRKFAKVTLIETKSVRVSAEQSEHLTGLGPEPLEPTFTFDTFVEQLQLKTNGKIKPTLMDQTIIAGIGNIYADESLWRAGIHPEERVKNLLGKTAGKNTTKLKSLYKSIRATLLRGIDFGGDSMSDYRDIYGERGKFQEQHGAYQKTGTRCTRPGCTGTILRKVIDGRSSHFCSLHQKI